MFPFRVKEAENGDTLKSNQVLIAPGGKQMSVNMRRGEYCVEIKDDLPVNRHKPSVDYLFKSAIDHKIPVGDIVAVLLTGMGTDGAAEMKNMHSLGIKTIAQDEATSVVFGMPREAIKLGAVDYTLPLKDIADQIIQLSKKSNFEKSKSSYKKVS